MPLLSDTFDSMERVFAGDANGSLVHGTHAMIKG